MTRQEIFTRAVGYIWAVAGIAVVTVVLRFALPYLNLGSVYLVYLVVVVGVAAWRGWGPSMLAALLAFLAVNFFFIAPVFTFAVAATEDLLALVIFLGLATGTSQVMVRLRREAENARRQAAMNATLYAFSATINPQPDLPHVIEAATERLCLMFDLQACRVMLDDIEGEGTSGEAVPAGATGDSAGQLILPLTAGGRRLGHLVLCPQPSRPPWRPDEGPLLSAIAEQLGTVIDRAQLQEAVTQAEVLRRTDALRAALISTVAHDLRSPLGAINAAATSLLSTRVSWSEGDRQALLEGIVDRVDHINRLIGNLLTEGRIEAGKLRPQKELCAVGDLIERVAERLALQLAAHPLTLDIPADLPPVPLDAVQIDEVLTNLLENAAKYTPPGTPVAVRVTRTGDGVAVQVADTGPGIPAEYLPHIFDRYYRVQTGATRGTGLGLAIARGIVEAHGGGITVVSRTTPPSGTTFTFTLPLPPSVPARQETRVQETAP